MAWEARTNSVQFIHGASIQIIETLQFEACAPKLRSSGSQPMCVTNRMAPSDSQSLLAGPGPPFGALWGVCSGSVESRRSWCR
jgi:hypothetical protein